jgi:tripeptide aminopeptidase
VNLDELVADIVEFASIPAPTFAETLRLEWLAERLDGAPGRRRRDEAGNLVWEWGDGRPTVAVLAHVDTVFGPEVPLEFVRDGDRLVGPGIGDNATAVVVALHVVRPFAERGGASAAVVFTVGEEGLGNLRGAQAACAGLRPEAVVALEGHGLEEVLVDGVGSARLALAVTGPGGHSWVDRGRPSAIHGLVDLAGRLVTETTAETPVNVGTISGGQSVNTIAARAELLVEMRALAEDPLERFLETARSLTVPPGLALYVDEVGRRPAGRLDRSAPLLATVRQVRHGLGLPDRLGAGSTDANAALAKGIPALTLGCARGGAMHTSEEWIEARSVDLGARQLAGVLAAVLDA